MKKDYKNMSNGEIINEMRTLENSYESAKMKAISLIDEMKRLDGEYIRAQKEIINRSNGKW